MNFQKSIHLTILLLIVFTGNAQESFIQLTNGEKINYKTVNLVYKEFEEPYFESNDNKTYTIEEVESFQNENGFFIKNSYTTSKRDFALRVLEGEIEIYKYNYSYNYLLTNGNPSRDHFVYKMGDFDLKQLNYENLSQDLNSNNFSLKKLNKVRAAKKISPVYYVLGGAGLASSATLFYNKSNFATPIFIASAAIITIPWLLNSRKQKRMVDAIKIYNGN